ncbi:IclR family transcriptional regulator [Ruicaihuangia caeni]|uniref:IclR family transcriptional regulator n=1 Tax=Ruicaihuangia caeni TaxID=3042517 RepID=UPI00338E0545
MSTDRGAPVSLLARATAILDCFDVKRSALGVSDIARRTGLPKSTVSRLVGELVDLRYLERDGSQVRLGLRLFELGELAAGPKELRKLAFASMADLRDATGQTVQLGVLDGVEVVYVGILRGRSSVKLPSRVGGRMPAYATGSGKALLAFSEPDVVERVIANGLDAVGPRTIIDPEAFRRELAFIRAAGVSYEVEESRPGIASAASCIVDAAGVPVAAMSISGRVGEFDARRVGLAVRTAVVGLMRQLPHRPLDRIREQTGLSR